MTSKRLDAGAVEALTFDCYGTLIDWLGGIRAACAAQPSLAACDFERLLADREEEEKALLEGPFRLYGEILAESVRLAGARQGREPSAAEARAVADSMGLWPAFPDSPGALRRLATRFRLALLSNVETRVLAASARVLETRFDELVTAEEVRSYKPARAHFDAALERLGLPKERVLHVAQSLHHDVRPAKALGWRAVWVDRQGDGPPAGVQPDATFPDLASVADALGL